MARTATVTRNTRETQITLTIDLDGTGRADLHTGIGFFDHMLDGFARHGLFDVSVTCRGDLDVDCHHTIEDIGIALGTAIKEALGDKAGLVRYGSCMLPMDETLALCAVDLGGRTLDASAESETMKAYRARALTSRAFGYYHLINVYQYPYSAANKDLPGVPLATEETLGQNLPRATMEQVYKRITDDLDEALRIFEEIGYDDTGSRTDFDASVAAILRARVALVMEDWGKAVSLADDILAKYTLVSKENYNSGFNRIENVPSLIFGFKMTADNCQTWATWCSQMDPYMSGYAGMWAERPIHSYLYARLNPTDVRRGWWLNKTDNPDPDAATSGYACLLPSNLPNTLASGVKARSEYVSVKFRSYNGDWNNTDLIYMRAEEAVFIKAEAEAHSNIAAAKKTLKDYVTTYRDPGYDITAASLDDVVEEIILQKRIEMWMEGALEWLDRRRLNMPIDRRDDAAMTAAGVANNHIYKAMWEQNESGMRFQLPRSVVIANPEIGEANQNKTN